MEFFNHDKILEIASKAGELGLTNDRQFLFAGINLQYVAGLSGSPTPQGQLLLDLSDMNRVSYIKGGVIPLEFWLKNAALKFDAQPQISEYFRDLADAVRNKSDLKIEDRPNIASAKALLDNQVAEKIVNVNDLVKFNFLSEAIGAGNAIAKMVVPAFEYGASRNFPMSTHQITGFGTGWLIGKQHIITNHHVINGRDPGETDASDSDFALQASHATAQFDYNHTDDTGETVQNLNLVAQNKDLDYAILKLSEPLTRRPLTLWGGPLSLGPDSYVPVNIIQHPGGTPKKIGMRNNLAVSLNEKDLAYFTDTEGGSSGSPVCNDEWMVIALHKAATKGYGDIEYQGNKTAWVNIGTRIDRIISDLKENHPAILADIKPDIFV